MELLERSCPSPDEHTEQPLQPHTLNGQENDGAQEAATAAVDERGKQGSDNQGNIARFRREVLANAELGEMGVAPRLLHIGTILSSDGTKHPYFASAYRPGITLDTFIHQPTYEPMSPELFVDILMLYAIQLSKAAKLGYVHRDLKPENLFIGHDGRTIILDWGLCSHGRSAAMTQENQFIGTPLYAASEAAGGDVVNATTWTDVSSLAKTMFHVLTGKTVFTGNVMEVIVQQVHHDCDLSPLRDKGLPDTIVEIFGTALSRDIMQRPDAEKFARQLWGYSSLYLAHGKIGFDEFLERFGELGRLNVDDREKTIDPAVPHAKVSSSTETRNIADVQTLEESLSTPGLAERTRAINSPCATVDRGQANGPRDRRNESASTGLRMRTRLLEGVRILVSAERERIAALLAASEVEQQRLAKERKRQKNRRQFMMWGSAGVTLAALAIESARLFSLTPESQPKVTVERGPHASGTKVFAGLAMEKLPNGRMTAFHLYPNTPAEITCGEEEFVALCDDAGMHALLFRLDSRRACKVLGYNEQWEGFPENDENTSIPTNGFEDHCVMFLDPATGNTATSYYNIGGWVVHEPNGSMSVYGHRLDFRSAQADIFEQNPRKDPSAKFSFHDVTDILKSGIFRGIIESFPDGLANCTDPTSKSPAGNYDRATAATIPGKIVQQIKNRFAAEDGRTATTTK